MVEYFLRITFLKFCLGFFCLAFCFVVTAFFLKKFRTKRLDNAYQDNNNKLLYDKIKNLVLLSTINNVWICCLICYIMVSKRFYYLDAVIVYTLISFAFVFYIHKHYKGRSKM